MAPGAGGAGGAGGAASGGAAEAGGRTSSSDAGVAGAGGSAPGGGGGGVGGIPQGGAGGSGGGGAAGSGSGGTGGVPAGNGGTSGAPGDGGPCGAVESAQAIEGASHTPTPCVPLTFLTNPPSSGTHYGIWTEFKTYAAPVPEGFWVHSLEHGAVVISYNCPEGCAAEVALAQAMIDALPVDQLCYPTGGTSLRRVVMTSDPHLTARFAASAWGFTLRATCFDAAAFRAFVDAHYGHGTESLCGAGSYVPGDYPPTCGEPPPAL